MCTPSSCGGQKMAMNPLELELRMSVSYIWVLGNEPSSLSLNHLSSLHSSALTFPSHA